MSSSYSSGLFSISRRNNVASSLGEEELSGEYESSWERFAPGDLLLLTAFLPLPAISNLIGERAE